MNSEKWKQIKGIFEQAVEMPAARRANFLDSVGETEIVREVGKMLAADTVDLFALSPVSNLFGGADADKMPEKIGVYKITREIGRGGMGAVYLAERDDGEFSQKVALKIIKRGMDSDEILRRFRNERQILAELQHPHIAGLLDGGVAASGSPFYAMEYVEGLPVDVYCRDKNLSVREKLELFRKICSAVSYAHSRLIVHRDLKPSNILVAEEGTPKLLDFGIAKITSAGENLETATQFLMMTPAYASPEQIRGEKITTLGDVYSLGVIFYELLTGAKPYAVEGKNYAEVVEIVCGSTPRKPSDTGSNSKFQSESRKPKTKTRNLNSDLDNIALKALQKDSSRRYQSVEKFSEDISRHLAGLPVTARPDTNAYRFGKFIRRNKIAAASAALIFASLCVGVTIAVWQSHRAEQQRVLAEKRFGEVRRLANSVVFKYHDAIAELKGSTAVREMLVHDALQYLDALAEESADDAALQTELALAYLKLGDVQGKMYAANVGDTEGALKSYRKAVGLLESAQQRERNDANVKDNLINGYDKLAFLILRSGNPPEAREIVQKALALHAELPPTDERDLQLMELQIRLGDVSEIGDRDSARLSEHLKALPIAEKLARADVNNYERIKALARIYQRLGTDYVVIGNSIEEKESSGEARRESYAEALNYHEKSLSAAEQAARLEPENASTERYRTSAVHNMAESLALNEKYPEALQLAGKNYDSTEAMIRADPDDREAKFNLSLANELFARIYLRQKDYVKYTEFSEKSLAISERIFLSDRKNLEVLGQIVSRNDEIATIHDQIGSVKKADSYRRAAEKFRSLSKSADEK